MRAVVTIAVLALALAVTLPWSAAQAQDVNGTEAQALMEEIRRLNERLNRLEQAGQPRMIPAAPAPVAAAPPVAPAAAVTPAWPLTPVGPVSGSRRRYRARRRSICARTSCRSSGCPSPSCSGPGSRASSWAPPTSTLASRSFLSSPEVHRPSQSRFVLSDRLARVRSNSMTQFYGEIVASLVQRGTLLYTHGMARQGGAAMVR